MMKRDVRNRETAILQLVSNRRDQDAQISHAWEKIQKQRPISLKNSFRQIMAAASYRPGGIKPGQPILLINGKGETGSPDLFRSHTQKMEFGTPQPSVGRT